METDKLIAELHRENLSTYFILPLLKLNKKKFVCEPNFIDSYLTTDGLNIFVKVMDTIYFMNKMAMHPQYQATWKDLAGNNFIQFSIQEHWLADVQTFIKGKYSRMSDKAKEMIRIHSTLQFRERRESDKKIITDIRLLALERSIAVKDLWEEHYGISLDKDDELLSIAESKAFIEITMLIREEGLVP